MWWPAVTSALLAQLPTLAGWSDIPVFDGKPVGATVAGNFCTVGFVDDEDAGSLDSSVSQAGNVFTAESGEIRSKLKVVSGDTTLSTLRATGFGLLDALRAHLAASPTLGVLPAGSTTSLSVQVQQAQDGQGAAVALIFTVSYSVPLY